MTVILAGLRLFILDYGYHCSITVILKNSKFRLRLSSNLDYGYHLVNFPSPITEIIHTSEHSELENKIAYTFFQIFHSLAHQRKCLIFSYNRFEYLPGEWHAIENPITVIGSRLTVICLPPVNI